MADLGWLDAALCAQVGGDEWFPDKGQPARAAKRVCHACPVRVACLEWALTSTETLHGVWGGTTHRERLALTPAQ